MGGGEAEEEGEEAEEYMELGLPPLLVKGTYHHNGRVESGSIDGPQIGLWDH